MTNYALSALVSLILLGMGVIALVMGTNAYKDNKESQSSRMMFFCNISVFLWDFGYAWMGLCYESDFAYVPRAIALLAVFIYMLFVLEYVSRLAKFSSKGFRICEVIVFTLALASWTKIIGKDAVSFIMTPWGYWYTAKMSIFRIIQFSAVIITICFFYYILAYWGKKTTLKREHIIIKRFRWFGIILFAGYSLDTLFPIVFKTAAIPGSSVAAFFSAILLYTIAKKYRALGFTQSNVSEYVFNELTIPVLVTDANGKTVLANEEASAFFGWSVKRILEDDWEQLLEKADMQAAGWIIRDSDKDMVFHRIIGTKRYCKINKTAVHDEYGDLLCTLVFIQDLTTEREAMRLIIESRKEAEAATIAKSNFLANMSHEIRTPMNAIIGMSDIVLRDAKLTKENRSQIEDIRSAGTGLLSIINDILDISKIEAGKMELIEDSYMLGQLIYDVSNIIDIRLGESATRLVINVDDTLPEKLIGDAGKVRQILLNILGNAVKFTHSGTIEFSITWNKKDEAAVLNFKVKDSGIGIKKEDLESIFGSFTQVDTHRNREVEGTGLGLAISKNMAMLMGGDITVESEYGHGSTFNIIIEQKLEEYVAIGKDNAKALEDRQYLKKSDKSEHTVNEYPGRRVLIVDDNRVNLVVAKGMMKPHKFDIDTALSGKEAMEMIKNNDYDIVFMDHMMPELDGVETTKLIRQMEDGKYKDLVIIALTANVLDEAKDLFEAAGMQDFLAKPINRAHLAQILDKWL